MEPTGDVYVKMTLTSPGCPAAGTLPGEVEDKIVVIPGVKSVKVEVVWEPTWDKEHDVRSRQAATGVLLEIWD